MKTKLISLLLSCIMFVSLAACTEDPSAASDEITGETTAAQTTEVITTQEETTVPVSEMTLNTDMFADIGLTYSQLVDKHGKLIEVGTAKGGVWYNFENGFGQYFWSWEDVDWGESSPLQDEDGHILVESAPLPKKDIQCMEIVIVDAVNSLPAKEENLMKVFSNLTIPETFVELEDVIKQTPGITDVKSDEELGDPYGYYTFDTYLLSGIFNNSSIQIATYKTDKFEIDSFLQISIHHLT